MKNLISSMVNLRVNLIFSMVNLRVNLENSNSNIFTQKYTPDVQTIRVYHIKKDANLDVKSSLEFLNSLQEKYKYSPDWTLFFFGFLKDKKVSVIYCQFCCKRCLKLSAIWIYHIFFSWTFEEKIWLFMMNMTLQMNIFIDMPMKKNVLLTTSLQTKKECCLYYNDGDHVDFSLEKKG